MDASYNTSPHTPATRPPRTDAEVRAFLASLPRYRLWLHDDSHHRIEDLAHALADAVAVVDGVEATRLCALARQRGRAEIMLCYREQAEHYRERMRAHLLMASIEPE